MKPSMFDTFISDLFNPFIDRVPGTSERLVALKDLKADLEPLWAASQGDRARLNPRGINLLAAMKRLVKEQIDANTKEQAWDPRRTPWCRKHWYRVSERSKRAASLSLIARFLSRLKEHGLVPDDASAFVSLRVTCSPICCWLGEDEMSRLYAEPEAPNGAG